MDVTHTADFLLSEQFFRWELKTKNENYKRVKSIEHLQQNKM